MREIILGSLFIILLVQLFLIPISAQTTLITYQGRLTEAGAAANGQYDFEFKLFATASGGAPIGPTVARDDVQVVNGIFTVQLDFGVTPFNPATANYVEIGVRPGASTGSFQQLSPRNPLTASPYAVQSLNAQTADMAADSQKLGGVSANQFVQTNDARLSDERNPLPNSPHYIQNNPSAQQTGSFNISGNGLIGGNLGIGTSVPNAKLDVAGDIRAVSPSTNGILVETTGMTAGALLGMTAPGRSWLLSTSVGSGNAFNLSDGLADTRMTVRPNGGAISFPVGNVGIGTTTPNTRLTLNGGPQWTSNGWTASMNMQNGSALGWEANASGQRFGIGQTGGGLYFLRTSSPFGSTSNPAQYDLRITDTGSLAQPADRAGLVKALLFVDGGGTIHRCYNGVTGAAVTNGTTNTGCGFAVLRAGSGVYTIDFGFTVWNRFPLVTTMQESLGAYTYAGEVSTSSLEPSKIRVYTSITDIGDFEDRSFYLAVF